MRVRPQSSLFHVDGYVDVGDGGSLVTQGHLRFGSADTQALQERRSRLAERMQAHGSDAGTRGDLALQGVAVPAVTHGRADAGGEDEIEILPL